MARPPHLFINDSIYFITCRTRNGIRFFNSDNKKDLIKKSIGRACGKYDYKIFTWVILDNHYHLLIKISNAVKLPNFIRYINSRSSVSLSRMESRGFVRDDDSKKTAAGKAAASGGYSCVWQNYWDRCIRNEKDFWTHFNYIHQNPVKHAYTKSMADYKFSSYSYYLKTQGQEWLDSAFINYSIINFHA